MRELSVDIETRSDVDLIACGMPPYIESPEFDILLFQYAYGDDPVTVIDLTALEEIPDGVLADLCDPDVEKSAFNAAFEIACLNKWAINNGKKFHTPANQWVCTMTKCAMLGLPMSLEKAGTVLKLDVVKDAAGKKLIQYFTIPCIPTEKNGFRKWNEPHHNYPEWKNFISYGATDVVVERKIKRKLSFYIVIQMEKELWALDQEINTRGMRIDRSLVENAIRFKAINKIRIKQEAIEITQLQNPNSRKQLIEWLEKETNEKVANIKKETIAALIESSDSEKIKRVLELKQSMGKNSLSKYDTMINTSCADGRIRAMLQYYGAGGTGRWAGRGVQPQNLPKNTLNDLDLARIVLKSGILDDMDFLFGDTSTILSQLLRTAFIASLGNILTVSDLAAIEARIAAWVADELWKLQVFNTHGKIYEAAGSRMFKVPIESVTKGSKLRDKSKIAELALGFQGGPMALITGGALRMGLTEPELRPLVDAWRAANPKIVQCWYDLQRTAIKAVKNTGSIITHKFNNGQLLFQVEKNVLFITLPSGRKLSYMRPRIKEGKFGGDALAYEGVGKNSQWVIIDTYGGMIFENVVQAIARDVLATQMLRTKAAGFEIVLHVHDEIVIDGPRGILDQVNKIMSTPIDWAPNLPLGAEGFETEYYKKD